MQTTAEPSTNGQPHEVKTFDTAEGVGGQSAAIKINKKMVFLAMPSYNGVASETFRAAHFLAAGLKEDGDYPYGVMVSERAQCSLLAFGFNQLWADCYNSDTVYDYWALLHADVNPLGPWLEILIDSMEEKGLDVIHAPVAIKDDRGLTSTAVGRYDDRWGLIRKISSTELQELPETFTIHDLASDWHKDWDDSGDHDEGSMCLRSDQCLLPNTGCMVVKLGPKFHRFRGFEINDRLAAMGGTVGLGREKRFLIPVDDPEWNGDGKVIAQVAPEDWNFGRWCASNGLRVGGCRKVVTQHFGRGIYPTWGQAWGKLQRDTMHLDRLPDDQLDSNLQVKEAVP